MSHKDTLALVIVEVGKKEEKEKDKMRTGEGKEKWDRKRKLTPHTKHHFPSLLRRILRFSKALKRLDRKGMVF